MITVTCEVLSSQSLKKLKLKYITETRLIWDRDKELSYGGDDGYENIDRARVQIWSEIVPTMETPLENSLSNQDPKSSFQSSRGGSIGHQDSRSPGPTKAPGIRLMVFLGRKADGYIGYIQVPRESPDVAPHTAHTLSDLVAGKAILC